MNDPLAGDFEVGDRVWWEGRRATLVHWCDEMGFWIFRCDGLLFGSGCAPDGYDGCGSTAPELLALMAPEDPIELARWLLR